MKTTNKNAAAHDAAGIKAVIMAGGEGKRLKAVTGALPKPMVPLLGKPIMEHCIDLLRENGIRDICATLRYNPGPIMDYFGDGERFGVDITWRVETQPLGTAGGVRACMDILGGGDFLVISGDAACDFDLGALVRSHLDSGAAVTVALYECSDPLRYGLAVPDENGDVRCFIEKPDWGRVVSDLVSTGIYVISPRAMEYVPDGKNFDFAADLFPLLLERGERIHGEVMRGYWCDVGTPRAYYQCCADALEGKLRLHSSEAFTPAETPREVHEHAPLAGENRRVLRVKCPDRAKLMCALSRSLMECASSFDDGLTIERGRCAARIRPAEDESELIIECTANDKNFAGELSDELAKLAGELK